MRRRVIQHTGVDIAISSLSYTETGADNSNLTTYTFSALSLGVADTDRFIVVCVVASGNSAGQDISSATIGGVSADIHRTHYTANDDIVVGIVSAKVPTGTTGDVVITFDGAKQRAVASVFRCICAADNLVEYDGDTNVAPTETATVNIAADSATFGCAGDTANGTSYTWTNLTEAYDDNRESESTFSTAYGTPAEQSALVITADSTSSDIIIASNLTGSA